MLDGVLAVLRWGNGAPRCRHGGDLCLVAVFCGVGGPDYAVMSVYYCSVSVYCVYWVSNGGLGLM